MVASVYCFGWLDLKAFEGKGCYAFEDRRQLLIRLGGELAKCRARKVQGLDVPVPSKAQIG